MPHWLIRLCIAASTVIFCPGLAITAANAAACNGFVDVDDSNTTYCAAVSYVADRGVTVGCTDSTHYCPNDYVTRLQMALFLQRMGRADPSNTLGDNTTAIGGGTQNTATGSAGTVGGGYANTATGEFSAVVGGWQNVAAGRFSTVAGGSHNMANEDFSIAAGQSAVADSDHCFLAALWSDGGGMTCLGSPSIFHVGADHGFSVDYYSHTGNGAGTRWVAIGDLITNATIGAWNGAYLSNGGTWINASDRAAKTDFTATDPQAVLAKVVTLPMDTWRYKTETDQRHMGPMAQDFYSAFGLGADDRHIATVDEGGVALAAIQGLNAKLEAQNAAQSRELAEVKAMLAILLSQRAGPQ